MVTRDWASQNQVTYGLANGQYAVDADSRAGRPTLPASITPGPVPAYTRNMMPAVSGKRTLDGRSQHYKGPYNPIAGTLINNGPNLGPQPTSS